MKFCGFSKSFKTGRNWWRFESFWIFDILRIQIFLNFQNRLTFTTQTADFKFVRNVLTNMLAFSKIGWDDIFFLSVIEYPNYTFQYDQGWVIKKSLLWELQGGDMKYLLSRICLLMSKKGAWFIFFVLYLMINIIN